MRKYHTDPPHTRRELFAYLSPTHRAPIACGSCMRTEPYAYLHSTSPAGCSRCVIQVW